MNKPRIQFRRWVLAGVTLAALAGLTITGAWFFRSERARVEVHAFAELTAIGKLKAQEVAAWRAERLADASVLTESPFVADLVARYFSDPCPEAAAPILDRFRGLQKHNAYADALLLDPAGRCVLSLSGTTPVKDGYRDALTTALAVRRPVLTDLHAGDAHLQPHLGVAAPFLAGREPDAALLGAVVLVCNAAEYLYPLLETWPLPGKTAEAILVRREGDQFLVLSDLRHKPDAALTLRLPLGRTDLPVSRVVAGFEEVVDGPDYRGARVLAYVTAIPDSSWFPYRQAGL